MLQPNKNIKKAVGTGKKVIKSSAISQVLSKIPFADEIYDVANIYEGLREGDYQKIGSNFIGALLPGVSGKAFEAIAEDWLPPTPEIEKKKMQFNLKSSPAERQELLKKYGPGYLSNPEFIKDQKLAFGTNSQGIMKKSMNPRKKYANGTNPAGVGPNNYIQSPNEVLNDYNIMLAKADLEVANNKLVPIVSMIGGLAQEAIKFGGAGGFNKGALTTPPKTAANGMNNVNSDVEVEGGEMYETPQGDTGEFQGPSHEQGGIPMEVNQDIPEGTKVYSDRLKVGDKTLAERKEARERQIANLEKTAAEPLIDSALKNATKRKMAAIQKEEMGDLQFQEQVNNMQQMADSVIKAFGTSVEGVQANPVGDSMRYAMGTGADGVTEYEWGTDEEGVPLWNLPSSTREEDPNYVPPFKKDIVGSADYDTNVIKNWHNVIGITPDTEGYGTAWGAKSKKAFGDWQSKALGLKGNYDQTKEDMLDGGFGPRNQKSSGLTEEGYKFNPQEPDMSGLVKPDAPFVEPTGVLAGMEKTYQEGKAAELAANPPGTMLSRGLTKAGTALEKSGGLPGMGDLVGMFGNYLGSTAGLKNAAEQRSTDITHRNVYANAGKESQKQLDNAMSSIENSKAQAIVKATTTTQGGKKAGRNSARGINQKRGMDWLYDTALNEQIASISANAANQVSDIFKTKSSVALSTDQLKGQGEYQANMANEAAKDAYYTAKGLGLKDQALGVQNIGKDLNTMKKNKVKWNIAKKSGTYGQGNDAGDITNKDIEITDPKTGKKISVSMEEYQKFIAQSTKSK
jgi:hypothetical protein